MENKQKLRLGWLSCLFVLSVLSTPSFGLPKLPYYGEAFYANLESYRQDGTLKKKLNEILVKTHVTGLHDYDIIAEKCPPHSQCYKHEYHSYNATRKYLFGFLDLKKDSSGLYVFDVYCQKYYRRSDFDHGHEIGPGQIPDPNLINAEHTWPQSKFTNKDSKVMQKSDLHALFPVGARVNSLRNNLDLGEVNSVTQDSCDASRRGYPVDSDDQVFEPPSQHKGNAARAMFYFATRYKGRISQQMEKTLRAWHNQDPVDAEELERHEKVFEYQKVRNPFVDHPELVNAITDF